MDISTPMVSNQNGETSYDIHGVPSTPQTGHYLSDLQTSSTQVQTSCFHKFARSWMVLRFQLARNFFAVPLPFLTSAFDIKLGDLLITLPICVLFIVTTAMEAIDRRGVESSGNPPTYSLLIVFILTVRNNSPLLLLTGIPYERVLFYHKIAAIVTIILSGLHGIAYILAYDKGEIARQGSMVFTGTVAFGAMTLLYIFSLNFVRRRFFEFFLRSHWILFIIVLVFAVLHGASTALIGIIPWILDMVFRHAYRPRIYARGSMFGNKKMVTENVLLSNRNMGIIARDQVTMTALPGDIIEIQFPRVRKDTGDVFHFKAGQYVFLCVPKISNLQWHPFTIASSPHESIVTFYIKALGDWSTTFQTLVPENMTPLALPVDILVDGPYGSVSIDLETRSTYSHFVLFAGGVGVTPMRSIVNSLHHESHNEGRSSIKRVHFVWSVRERELVQSLVVDAQNALENKVESYFPNGILTNRSTVFSTEIHVTRSDRDVESNGLDRLGSCLRFGARPDIADSLRTIGEQAKQNGKKRVAVLVCGPSSMVSEVIAKSLSLSWKMKIRFDVHTETFEF
ncbi:hypothetical protein CCR75_009482 [Bremia lactucae]|uniref:FAD-binding FR-type domain-containing protein n=1 Tax=Bremia lactucae TaxID=4779 RepID=A0A976FPV7_BRELC|nr:hypothetical protein CCR75_009482 [Bremia lactucae]